MEHPLSASCLRAQRALIAVAVAGTALAVWPSRTETYGLPKATLAVMVAVLLAALTLVRSVVRKRVEVPGGLVALAMAAVIACMAAATSASSTPAVSAVGPTRYTGFIPYFAYFVIALTAMSAFRKVKPALVLNAILFAGGIQVAYGLIQAVGWQPLPFGSNVTPIFGTLGNSNFFSGWLGITAPVALWAALDRTTGTARRRVAGTIAVGCLALIWRSGSIQGLPAAVAGLLVVGVTWLTTDRRVPGNGAWRRRLTAIPAPALTTAVAISGLVVAGVAFGAVTAAWQNVRAGGSARLEYWAAARDLVADYPVLGTGPGTFVQHYASYYKPIGTVGYELADDPHSVPLAMLTGGGFVVGVVYLALVLLTAAVLIKGLRRTAGRDRVLLAALGGAWVAYQVQSLVSIDIPPLALAHWVLAAAIATASGSVRFLFERVPAPEDPGQRRKPRRRSTPLDVGTKVAIGGAVVVAAVLLVFTTRPMRGVAAAERVDELISSGDPRAALREARRAVKLAPWDDRAWSEYRRVAKGLEEFEEARRAAQRAVELAPGNSAYALELASLAQRQQDFDESIRWSRHAAKVDPRNTTVLARAARNLLTYGLGPEAERLARQGLRLQETAELWAVLGLRYTLDGRETQAIDAYRRAVRIDPTHQEAKTFLENRLAQEAVS